MAHACVAIIQYIYIYERHSFVHDWLRSKLNVYIFVCEYLIMFAWSLLELPLPFETIQVFNCIRILVLCTRTRVMYVFDQFVFYSIQLCWKNYRFFFHFCICIRAATMVCFECNSYRFMVNHFIITFPTQKNLAPRICRIYIYFANI